MEITYTHVGDYRVGDYRVGDYYLPNLAAPESPKVGHWGMLCFSYLRNHREALYTTMLMQGTLNPHPEKVDRQAHEMEQQLRDCQEYAEQNKLAIVGNYIDRATTVPHQQERGHPMGVLFLLQECGFESA